MRESHIIKAIDLEELKGELTICCTEEAKEVVKAIKLKFKKIEKMMDKQLEVNERWD